MSFATINKEFFIKSISQSNCKIQRRISFKTIKHISAYILLKNLGITKHILPNKRETLYIATQKSGKLLSRLFGRIINADKQFYVL